MSYLTLSLAQPTAGRAQAGRGDRGFTSDAFREYIWDMGARAAPLPRRHEALIACPYWIYDNRHHVERLWAGLNN